MTNPRSLLADYSPPPDRFNELASSEGVRTHWQSLFAEITAATPEEMRTRCDFINDRIRENGITYNVYADPKGVDRPLELDPLPFVLPAAEWAGIERAVAQRARLLDLVLADIYGEQRLLKDGSLPPALVFGHRGYLWSCQGGRPPGNRYLYLYAADLARAPNGHWWVIADRTQTPSGAGYAIENRLIISRLFPTQFRHQHVRHLAGFFQQLQEGLAALAPLDPGETTPHIVLLTPGPYNETYFEHAYLARYLGIPLVQGQDLTVRGDTLYLKTLLGLKRVHAVLRRLDDDYCDPLELRPESALGVPGLVRVASAGRVVMANALGSGVLESAGLMAFLPALCKTLLGEELQMPAVATWWCGEAHALEYVGEHLEQLAIRPAFPSAQGDLAFGPELAADKAEWLRRLRARPAGYVAQELVHLSQAPIVGRLPGPRLLPRAIGLRVYAVATPNGYHVMPGGLTRVAGEPAVDILTMQHGGISKDTWVLSDQPVGQISLFPRELGAQDVVRADPELPSRIAENLFWLGRYTERVENSARLLRLSFSRLLGEGGELETSGRGLAPGFAFTMCHDLGFQSEATADNAGEGTLALRTGDPLRHDLLNACFEPGVPGGLAESIQRALWCASNVRERLSFDHWHTLNKLQRIVRVPAQERLARALSALHRVLLTCTSLSGFFMDEMLRDAGWHFMIIGRRIERLLFLSRAAKRFLDGCRAQRLDVCKAVSHVPDVDALLELAGCDHTFRLRPLARGHPDARHGLARYRQPPLAGAAIRDAEALPGGTGERVSRQRRTGDGGPLCQRRVRPAV
jgi:uncharacterized circularly permuted ATP-grasp superfamily protein/uncharacterized alpha-E superfamily protein